MRNTPEFAKRALSNYIKEYNYSLDDGLLEAWEDNQRALALALYTIKELQNEIKLLKKKAKQKVDD